MFNKIRISSILIIFFLAGCSKDQQGGVIFTAVTSSNYNYSEFSVRLLDHQYGSVIKEGKAARIDEPIALSTIPDGNYYWSCYVAYDSVNISRNKTFGGEVVIEKKKIKGIFIEVD